MYQELRYEELDISVDLPIIEEAQRVSLTIRLDYEILDCVVISYVTGLPQTHGEYCTISSSFSGLCLSYHAYSADLAFPDDHP